jgi:hypothetical protein
MTEAMQTPTEIIATMEATVERLKLGSAILYNVIQDIYNLHEIEEWKNDPEDTEEAPQTVCSHCSEICEAPVLYPCPTVQILLVEFEVEEVSLPETDPQSD